MNFTGQHLYSFDQPFHLQNSNTVEYVQSVSQLPPGIKDNNYVNINNQLISNNFIPFHPSQEGQYMPMFDPYMAQTINPPFYPLHNGNYPYNYSNSETNIDRCYLGVNNQLYLKGNEYYNPLLNYNTGRTVIPQINYQSNQITVVPNIQINSNESITYSANNFIEVTQNTSESLELYNESKNRSTSFRTQENHNRNFKFQRNKTRSILLKQTNNEKTKQCNSPLPPPENPDSNDSFIEVLVTNLDYNIGAKEWKKLLYNQFQSALKRVHSVYIQTQTDGSNCALVRVNSIEDARLAISQFHRKKIGYKRIQVNLVNSNINLVSGYMKQEVASLLKSVAGYSLSVFKFMELYEKRYHRNISISDFYKMKDFVEIKDVGGNQNGKIISLTNMAINYIDQTLETPEFKENFESSICTLHCKEGTEDYLTAIDSSILPNVEIKLKLLKDQVHKILQSHDGDLPLMSFLSCYKVDFDDIKIIKTQNSIENLESEIEISNNDFSQQIIGCANKVNKVSDNCDGIPLEHLISCIPGIKITAAIVEVRKIQWDDKKDIISSANNGLGGVLVDRLHQFSREVVDLIKHQAGCKILLSKFIPTYHHHFGKQCRVADYGFSKLHELIDALPQVVHVIGFGYMRMLYLSHKVQVRRFTNELMKVLKSQSTKTCLLSEYPLLYTALFHKEFNVTDYGVCYLDDLLDEIPDSTVEIIKEDNEVQISMPKRIQSSEEKERTTQFSTEVIDLLKQTPRCKLPFNKFIPSYHHHFSRQCKVAEYGFTKLIELLEAIPLVVQIVEEHGEKYVLLTQYEMLRVLGEQTLNILEKSVNKRVQLSEFPNVYMKTTGYPLNVEDFLVNNMKQLFSRIPKVAKIQGFPMSTNMHSFSPTEDAQLENLSNKSSSMENIEFFVCLADRNHIKYLAYKVLLILLEVSSGSLPDYQFMEKYHYKYREEPNITTMENELNDIIQVVSDSSLVSFPGSSGLNIRLKPLILFSRDLKDLIKFNQCKMPIVQLELIYEQQYGIPLTPQNYGYSSLLSLIQACDFVVSIKGRGVRAMLILNPDFVGKLAYRVAYSTEPFINNLNDSDETSYQVSLQNLTLQTSNEEEFSQFVISTSSQPSNLTSSPLQQPPSPPTSPHLSSKGGCMTPLIYNPYIHPQTNFLPSINSYPYFNAQPMYNTWFRQWYQPHSPYGFPPNMYPPPEYGILPLTQPAIPQASLSQTCVPYPPAASQDQKQIDELVETLAYDNSCSSRITPPPSSLHHMQNPTFDGTNTIIPSPWITYPVQQIMSPNLYHNPYSSVVSTANDVDDVGGQSSSKGVTPSQYNLAINSNSETQHCTNNNNNNNDSDNSFIVEEHRSLANRSFFSELDFHSMSDFSKSIS